MPIYPKGDKWRVVVWHRGVRHDWIQEGTKAEAELFEAAKRVELRAVDPASAGRIAPTLSEFSRGAYRTHAMRHLKKRTWTNRVYTLANLIDRLGDLKLSEIATAHIEEYKASRREDEIGPSTINDELKILRTVLAYARELGLVVAQPMIKDLSTHGIRRRVTAWTRAEVSQLLKHVGALSRDIEPLVVFLLNTGCRKGEALALEWKNVDLKRGLIFIEPSEEWQPKDGEARQIPISDALMKVLRRKPQSKRWVFPNEKGERYAFWPQRAFDRAREAAGLKGGPHTCRHTFATHFLQGRPDMFLLARLLGHSTAYVTELYSHVLPDHLATARNVVSLGAKRRARSRHGSRPTSQALRGSH